MPGGQHCLLITPWDTVIEMPDSLRIATASLAFMLCGCSMQCESTPPYPHAAASGVTPISHTAQPIEQQPVPPPPYPH